MKTLKRLLFVAMMLAGVISAQADWVSGAFMAVRRAAIEHVGGLDESYFMYAEEMDWCLRFRRAGWLVYFVPEARVYHGVSQTVARLTEGELAYYAWRNHYLLATMRGQLNTVQFPWHHNIRE